MDVHVHASTDIKPEHVKKLNRSTGANHMKRGNFSLTPETPPVPLGKIPNGTYVWISVGDVQYHGINDAHPVSFL